MILPNSGVLLSSVLLLGCVLFFYPLPVVAFTLEDAMILAHENNYKILSENQNYNAARMSVPKAYSGLLPSVTLNNSNNHVEYKNQATRAALGDPYYRQYGLTVSQPIFNGGSTYAQIKIANNAVSSGLSNLQDVSSSITVNTVQAYEGVLSTREIYEINLQNQKIFEKYLEFTKIRFEAGVITRTDVLQAEVRLSDAKAQGESAYANMKNTEANFEHIVGQAPETEMDPIIVENISLPQSIDELIEIAKENNPTLKTNKYNAESAKYQVNLAVSQVLPKVSANATVARLSNPNISQTGSSNTYTLNVNVPIFQGGGEYANIAQQRYLAKKAEFDELEVERLITEKAISIWNSNKTAKSIIKARFDSITAAEKALEGVKEEVNVGTRTTIDLLNAEGELFNARVAHRRAKVELVVSVYDMLQIMGQINPINLEYNN